MNEEITKAVQCAELLAKDLRSALTKATNKHSVCSILLRDLLKEISSARYRIEEIQDILTAGKEDE